MKCKILIKFLPFALFMTSACASGQGNTLSTKRSVASDPTAFTWKSHVLTDHPRLYVNANEWDQLKSKIQTDPLLNSYYSTLEKLAENMLDLTKYPLPGYVNNQPVPNGQYTGADSAAIDRSFILISTLSGLFRLDGDQRKLNRATLELRAIANMQSWPQDDFLLVARLTHAESIGYDWLYNHLANTDLMLIRNAIVTKSLQPGLAAFQAGTWWTKSVINWTQVCAAGLSIGALAVANKEPVLAKQLLDLTETAMEIPTTKYAPDGGWDESVDYSVDGTLFFTYYLSTLRSALGYQSSLLQAPGVSDYGKFRIHTMGPLYPTLNNTIFNFGDDPDPENDVGAPEMFWFAKVLGNQSYAESEVNFLNFHPAKISIFDLFWARNSGAQASSNLPLNSVFKRVAVATLRTAWNQNAIFVGFKGGVSQANHGHLDHGSFVLDADGERWVQDLGRDDYSLPGYFDTITGKRWSYYRLGTAGHNTVSINGTNQKWDSDSPLIGYQTNGDHPFAVTDLTSAYPVPIKRAWRGISLVGDDTVIVEDEIDSAPISVDWHLHTIAQISLIPNGAIFTQNGKQIFLKIISPPNANFTCSMRNAPTGSDCQNITDPVSPLYIPSGVSKLSLKVAKGVDPLRIVVSISTADKTKTDTVTTLSDWLNSKE